MGPDRRDLSSCPSPANHETATLYFAALTPFATYLCRLVRTAAQKRVVRTRGTYTDQVPVNALQIVVPNRTSVAALWAARIATSPTSPTGQGVTPDPRLVEAGKHLRSDARARAPPARR